MARNIISSWGEFSRQFKTLDSPNTSPERPAALKKYFDRGGVISVIKQSGKEWPKLTYPSPDRVQSQLKELQEIRGHFNEKKKSWQKVFDAAKIYDLKHNMLKVSKPLYWKHVARTLRDPDYKQDAEKVKLPAHLVGDKRWEPMVRMFVLDDDYRKQLTETVSTSVAYSADRKVAKYARDLKGFRIDLSTKEMAGINKKIEELDNQILTFQTILKWADES